LEGATIRGRSSVPLSSCGVRAFAHAGPSLWNTLPVHLKNRNLTLTTFISLFSVLISYWARLGCDHINALYKFTITSLLLLLLTTTSTDWLTDWSRIRRLRVAFLFPSALFSTWHFWEIYSHFSYSRQLLFMKLGDMTDADQRMIPRHFGMSINPEIRIRSNDQF